MSILFISELTVRLSAVMAKEREEGGRELQERGSPELRGTSLVKLEGKADGPLQATSRMAAALCATFWPSEEGPGHLHSWCGAQLQGGFYTR